MLETVDLKYAYGKDKYVLNGINAHFEPGKMYAVLGESGGGKTTLLSLLGGLDEPTSGEIRLNGKTVSKNNLLSYRKNDVAFIFQSYNLIDYLTPAENVRLSTKKSPFPILEKVGLTRAEATRSVLRLSGGQQQRVAIARALASSAGILLADEPTGNLDEETALVIIGLLKSSVTDNNKCVIVVTHSKELAQHADVVLGLKQGLLQQVEL
jgi:putative ABC transport system ATP-binding protein